MPSFLLGFYYFHPFPAIACEFLYIYTHVYMYMRWVHFNVRKRVYDALFFAFILKWCLRQYVTNQFLHGISHFKIFFDKIIRIKNVIL